MAFETKDEILHKILNMKKPECPHCKTKMTLWEVPQITFSDGLGWGTPYMFVCFNDKCLAYKEGWDNLKETTEYNASYRCINSPGTDNFEYMPVFSPMGGKGQILDNDELAIRKVYKEAMKQGFMLLTDFYISKAWDEILKMLLDPTNAPKVRLKAVDMVKELGGVEAIDPLVNHKFPFPKLQEAVNNCVKALHEKYYTKECPYCAEIIKKRAAICKHCNKKIKNN